MKKGDPIMRLLSSTFKVLALASLMIVSGSQYAASNDEKTVDEKHLKTMITALVQEAQKCGGKDKLPPSVLRGYDKIQKGLRVDRADAHEVIDLFANTAKGLRP